MATPGETAAPSAVTLPAGGFCLWLDDEPAIRFIEPPKPVVQWLEKFYRPLLSPLGDAPVHVRFRSSTVPLRSVMLAIERLSIAGTPDGRILFVDGKGRVAQLPRRGETELICDPDFDRSLWGPFHSWLERLLDAHAARREMVTFRGAVVAFREGAVAISAFQGSGKSSTLLSLLPVATAYLGDDRLTIGRKAGRVRSLSFPVPLRLAAGRRYDLPRRVLERSLGRLDLAAMTVAARAPGRIREMASDRWVSVEVGRAFPHVSMPRGIDLDAMVFLQPWNGPITAESLDAGTGSALARALARSRHDRDVTPIQLLHDSVFPDDPGWPTIPAMDHHLPAILDGLPLTLLRVPVGGAAAAVGDAVRRVLVG